MLECLFAVRPKVCSFLDGAQGAGAGLEAAPSVRERERALPSAAARRAMPHSSARELLYILACCEAKMLVCPLPPPPGPMAGRLC